MVEDGGEGGIRTHETRQRLAVFKTAAFNRSATSPRNRIEDLEANAACDNSESGRFLTGVPGSPSAGLTPALLDRSSPSSRWCGGFRRVPRFEAAKRADDQYQTDSPGHQRQDR